jgi:hypothetical protein
VIRKATCCCGKISIEVKADPVVHAVCHCGDCKKRTGSAFGISAYFANTSIVNRTGTPKVYSVDNKEYKNRQQRHFCGDCGTTLFWTVSTLPELTGVAGGCFVDDPLPEPAYTVSNDGKCAWLQLPTHWKTSIPPGDFARTDAGQ